MRGTAPGVPLYVCNLIFSSSFSINDNHSMLTNLHNPTNLLTYHNLPYPIYLPTFLSVLMKLWNMQTKPTAF